MVTMDGLDGTTQRLADFPDVGALGIKGNWQRADDAVLIRSLAWP
jgi:hypothetical protein